MFKFFLHGTYVVYNKNVQFPLNLARNLEVKNIFENIIFYTIKYVLNLVFTISKILTPVIRREENYLFFFP